MPEVTIAEWERFYHSQSNASFLQSPAWGNLKEKFGWNPVRIIQQGSGAQMLIRNGPLGIRLGYVPKGPLGMISPEILEEIFEIAKEQRCFVVTLEPDLWENAEITIPAALNPTPGRNIQPRRTILVSLGGTPDDWLGRMKQKTRYNMRLAEKKDVRIVESEDTALFHQLMEKTGKRDGFGIHNYDYYDTAFQEFRSSGEGTILLATFEQQPLGALMVFAHGKTAWYVYGSSNDLERNRMPTYLLQWEAMKWAAQKGCETYDLWGIPDVEEKELEEGFETRSDGLWGVYRFKRGFGGEIRRSARAIDLVINGSLYAIYRRFLRRGRD